MTSLQNRALKVGMAATLQRTKERQIIIIKISAAPQVDRQSVFDDVRYGLLVKGGLNPATTTIELTEDHSAKDNTIAQLVRENRQLRRQLGAVTLLSAEPAKSGRWMRVREAAEELGISKATLYRAIEDGRIATKSTPVRSKKNHEVDPKTFKRKQRTKKNQPN